MFKISVKFWLMIPMNVKYNHTDFEQATQRGRPGVGFTSGAPRCQNLSKWPEKAFFWHCGVPIRSLEKSIGKEMEVEMQASKQVS